MRRRQRWIILGSFLLTGFFFVMGIQAFQDRRYVLISVAMAFFACIPFYYAYEKRKGSIRRMVLIAVMVTLAVAGRLLFSPLPSIKPVSAIVIIAGIYMGAETGFLVGSLSAIVSNLFFGQGPWTPFQMLAWGVIGFVAGLPVRGVWLKNKRCLAVFGIFSGIFYSTVMNVWAAISFSGSFSWSRFVAAMLTSLPTTAGYIFADVVFLSLLSKPLGDKLNRIRIKHEIF